MKRILVTGGAGFLGSHLCERLLQEGSEVLCVDNFFTGSKQNIAHLLGNPMFELMRHDVTFPLYVEVDEIYNLACPASPIHYQYDPVQTTKTSVLGVRSLLLSPPLNSLEARVRERPQAAVRVLTVALSRSHPTNGSRQDPARESGVRSQESQGSVSTTSQRESGVTRVRGQVSIIKSPLLFFRRQFENVRGPRRRVLCLVTCFARKSAETR